MTLFENVEFMSSVLQGSTEYSIVGTDLDGKILLWNEGARRLYGYDAAEVVDKARAQILHKPEEIQQGQLREMMDAALSTGKWEGTAQQMRKDGQLVTARVVITPRREVAGHPVGFVLVSKDISAETRVSEELKAVQFYTRSLIESDIDALITTEPLGIITDVNQQMQSLTGYDRQHLIGSAFKNYFTDPKAADDAIKCVLREGRITNCELTAIAKDGRLTVVSYNASTFRDELGNLQGVFAAARDITEQREMERRLRDSEAYHRGLIEASVDGLITVNPNGIISDVNQQLGRMTGYSREELIGTPFADYFVDAESATAGVAQTFDKGEMTDYVLTLATHDRKELRVSLNASVFKDPLGKVRGIFASVRDITNQYRLQTQLAEERAYNRGLIEASLDGLITVDPILIITDVNETMCRMSGYSRQELIGSPFPQHFADSKQATRGVRLTLNKGSATNYELKLRTKDKREILVSFNAAIFKDRSGVVRGIFASARDITNRARLQAHWDEERSYNRGLIEASVDGLVIVDEAMNITDVNETMCRMTGRLRGQLIGSSFPTYFTERERAADGVRRTFKEGAVKDYVLTLQPAKGNVSPVSLNAAVFKDSSGKARGICVSARDITAQKRLETQLQASQIYTRLLIESNIDALITTDPVGVITDVNQQMEKLTGRNRDKLIGTPFKSYFTVPERAEEGIVEVLREGRVTNYELTLRSKDQREIVVAYNAVTFHDANGKLQGVFAAVRDITDQKKLEAQLREQQTYLRGLIESSGDGLITIDPDGTITDVNGRMCQMSSYTRDQLLGTSFADYFTDPEHARAGVQQTYEAGPVTELELTLASRTRRLLHVSFNASVFQGPSGKTCIFASIRDITYHVRLEEQSREQQAYLRGLIESSVDGLITVDADGFITDVNQQMCRMTGYERMQLVGSAFTLYFTDPDRADLGIRQIFANGMVTDFELVLQTRTGRKATVSLNASVFNGEDGQAKGILASARDISEQARLRYELAEQQSYNRSLIEASADALFVIAADGVVTDVNVEATRLTGYTRKHLINSRFSTYFTDLQRARAVVHDTLGLRRLISYELMLVTRHGRHIGVSINAGVFTDSAGATLGILAAARDITKQKRLEQQLRDQQYYTRSLIESNIDGLMTTDALGIVTDCNQQMEQLTGCSRVDLIGSPFKAYFTDPQRAEDGIRQVLREGKVTNYDLTVHAKDGKETVVSYNATTFNDQDGKLQGVFAAARDVTERKRAESHLRGLLESAPEAMVIVNQAGKIILVNSQTEKLFGYDRQELLGQSVKMLVPEQFQPDNPIHRPANFQNPQTQLLIEGPELFGRRKNGSEFPVEISLSPLETDEETLVSSSIRDITERKRVERTIHEKNLELERANQAKDRFLTNMSHELRTPLNAVIGFTGTLLMRLPGPLNEEQEDQLRTVERSAMHLLSLINDLLDLAKIESGNVELQLVPVLCRNVIHEVIDALKPMCTEKQLALTSEIPQREVFVRTDRRALTQIVLNLATNALKFTERGAVQIKLSQHMDQEEMVTEISVTDTGIGIRTEDQHKLFQAFERVRVKGGVVQQGTGLGLYICQKLANLLGGQIHFESESGKGSTFTLAIKES